ncbi:DNA-binding PadR family transcriptional regulator [Paenibacillus castaneae]|uniref:PadR family transcriptional regulator n=1 Tax=Paenibacillus castaneae TaxID=474957 RepID=UPI000C99B666|nr:PadR family transcriptional regulator [Paenibacillus castaneae]NIK79479.1 DNA-binding PadR family transcriptional regulator [Paenibacillus castaneae]
MTDRQQYTPSEQPASGDETNAADERRSCGKRYFGRGGVKFALLKLLDAEPMHGYQMMKALEEQSGGLYVPSAGTIYPTLQMLEERGFVSIQEESGKKIYQITEQGRSALLLLPDKSISNRAGEGGYSPEAESFRFEKMRRKLGLSNESFELLRLVARAERETSASQERKSKLQQLLKDQQQQIDHFLTENESKGEAE